jgi:hypothetical protein
MGRLMITILILFSWKGIINAQDFKQVMKDMQKEYTSAAALDIVMKISVFDDTTSQVPYVEQYVEIKKGGDNYWYKVDENEMLLNDHYLITVDRNSKQISCSRRDMKAQEHFQSAYRFNLDSIFALYDNPQFLGTKLNVSHYKVIEKEGPIEQVHFFIEHQSGTLKKIEYNYREGQFVSIDFIAFERKASFDPKMFSEIHYVVKVDNKFLPSAFYKNYKVSYHQ